ncbi:helix-turn-helix transcriptional regulator (plasmid) [Microbulbifer sp. MKSA007]|nr:helix-turn-helix transcriptional regulator [Microbulbifer sp. MKSA007]
MAEELGISQSAYSRWEKDPDGLDGYQLADLAKILGCSARDLRTDSAKAAVQKNRIFLRSLRKRLGS